MALGSLDGFSFTINPESLSWDFTLKTSVTYTVGGKVVQIYGTTNSSMKVSGTFGRGVVDFTGNMNQALAQHLFREAAQKWALKQSSERYPVPLRFLYPDKGWDFMVNLVGWTAGNSSKSVVVTPEQTAPKWALQLAIVDDNANLKNVAADVFLTRLGRGIGWKRSNYNGASDYSGVDQVLKGMTLQEYLVAKYNPTVLLLPTNSTLGGGTAGGAPGSVGKGVLSPEVIANILLDIGFTNLDDAADFLAIAKFESSFNSETHNDTPATQDDSYGLWQINMLFHRDKFSGQDLFDPVVNANAMWIVSGGGRNKNPWSVYKNGKYLGYLDEARRIVRAEAAKRGK